MTSGARFVRADRHQTRWDFIDLEALLPSDHRARVVLSFVESLDLSALYEAIKAREGEPGRPPADPAVLLALWLYATIEGVGSARQLDRLAQSDVAYRWLAGGVPLNYHGLADFRVAHVEVLDRLLTDSARAMTPETAGNGGSDVRRRTAHVVKTRAPQPTRCQKSSRCWVSPRQGRGGGISTRRSPSKRTRRTWSLPMRAGSEQASTRVTSVAPSKV